MYATCISAFSSLGSENYRCPLYGHGTAADDRAPASETVGPKHNPPGDFMTTP
jgi:hypothetical protein